MDQIHQVSIPGAAKRTMSLIVESITPCGTTSGRGLRLERQVEYLRLDLDGDAPSKPIYQLRMSGLPYSAHVQLSNAHVHSELRFPVFLRSRSLFVATSPVDQKYEERPRGPKTR
jgi:hypothetical protein